MYRRKGPIAAKVLFQRGVIRAAFFVGFTFESLGTREIADLSRMFGVDLHFNKDRSSLEGEERGLKVTVSTSKTVPRDEPRSWSKGCELHIMEGREMLSLYKKTDVEASVLGGLLGVDFVDDGLCDDVSRDTAERGNLEFELIHK